MSVRGKRADFSGFVRSELLVIVAVCVRVVIRGLAPLRDVMQPEPVSNERYLPAATQLVQPNAWSG